MLLEHKAYQGRAKLRGYRSPVSAFQTVTTKDAGDVLISLCPTWTREDHRRLAHTHAKLAERDYTRWNRRADEAAQATFGRTFSFTDYRISGIGREEFPDEFKVELRKTISEACRHKILAHAHAAAAKSRRIH